MRSLVVVAALTAYAVALAPGVAAGAGSVVTASVHDAPAAVPGTDGWRHLVYEVLVENRSDAAVRFRRVTVREPGRRRALASYRGRALAAVLGGGRTLAAGAADAVFLDVALLRGAAVPTRLVHELVLSRAGRRLEVTGARTRVDRGAPLLIGPPLHGGGLVVIGCCGAVLGHRRGLMEVDGRLSLSQRYAIDFIQFDDELRSFAGDPARNDSYFIFGDEVIAVAPGRVSATRNDLPDNTPPNSPEPDLDTAAGNFVTQDLGGRTALYAHMQPGSVRVSPGQMVARGDVLGLVGNSGVSSQAHLHFHVVSGPGVPSRLAGDGVPYVFDRFEFQAHVNGLEDDPPAPVVRLVPPPNERMGLYPFTGDIVGFP